MYYAIGALIYVFCFWYSFKTSREDLGGIILPILFFMVVCPPITAFAAFMTRHGPDPFVLFEKRYFKKEK